VRPGEVIDGKYQIEAELGEGGMGRVLAASHLTLGSSVAIKLLKSEAMRVPQVAQRFLREARAAGRLRNEHVARVMDVGELPSGEPFMVMELLRGVDLATMVEQGRVPPVDALEYVAQACVGLAEAHAMGMVHRDIKPANLFVTRRPNGAPLVKVLDFGIATAAVGDSDHGLTSTLTVMGSPSYMSPEQLRAARDVDARSDIWSLGVTLYELLTGEQPFEAPTLTALTLRIVSEPHTPMRDVPPALAAIVDRCLDKERERRFANVVELAAALAPLFPNGRMHAEMVAGALQQPLPAWSAWPAGGSGRVAAAGAADPMATTTGLTAGESSPMLRRGSRRRTAWIVVGAAAMGAIVSAGLVLSQGSPGGEPAAAQPEKVEPAKEPEPAAKAAEPALTPAAAEAAREAAAKEAVAKEAAPAVEPAAAAATKEPEPAAVAAATKEPEAAAAATKEPEAAAAAGADRPLGKPSIKRPPVKRPPAKAPADPARPAKEPAKKPCAPNDPTCGL
jgi:serine/threonine-protein kinase